MDEIIGGLRNAVERGSSIEEAAQSFVRAGYSTNDVQEAVKKVAPNTQVNLDLVNQGAPANINKKSDPHVDKIKEAVDGKELPKPPANPATNSVMPPTPPKKPETPTTPQPPAQPTTNPAATPTTTPTTPGMPPAKPGAPVTAQTIPGQQPPKKSNKKTVIILGVVFILLLIGLVVTILFGDKIAAAFS